MSLLSIRRHWLAFRLADMRTQLARAEREGDTKSADKLAEMIRKCEVSLMEIEYDRFS